MSHLLYLIFRCDFDMMENLEKFGNLNTPRADFDCQCDETDSCHSTEGIANNAYARPIGEHA